MKYLICFVFFFLSSNVSFSQQEAYRPLRIEENILLDGKLDEPVWQRTPVESDFMQLDPQPGGIPTEKTEVRILYNNEYLFVGVHSFDSDPLKIIQLGLERDYELGQDDGPGFLIDTYSDKSSGLVFVTNPLGARWDSQISFDGAGENDSYNTYWEVECNIDSTGYTTEYRVPFSSLRFETKPIVIMGFRVTRYIKRKNELMTFPKFDPKIQNGWINVSFAREIQFNDLKGHKPFYITPYVAANYFEEYILNETGTQYIKNSEFITRKNYAANKTIDKILSSIGADMKYGLSKNFTLDLTLNTDFSQAEVDDRIINLTKYDVNLPEKRSFFLESAGYLSFSFPAGNEMFISRKIGNEENREGNNIIVPIIAGARMTGKSKGWQMGILDMQTTGINEELISPHNYFVFRTRRDIDSLGSFVGGIFTNRINTDTSRLSNQTCGADFVKKINPLLFVEGGIAATTINAGLKSFSSSSYYNLGIFRGANEGASFSAIVDIIGKEFYPEVGYLDENNYGLASGSFGYQIKAGENSKVEYWYANTNESYRWKLSPSSMETFDSKLFTGVTFKSGADINFSLFEYKIDSLLSDWILDDHNAISAGKYNMLSHSLNFTVPGKSLYSGTLSINYGKFYGGTRFFISPFAAYSLNKHFKIGITYEYNHIEFPAYLQENVTTYYISNLMRINLAYLFSAKLSVKVYMQFDDLSHQISNNLRIRYNPREGTDLYIVFNTGFNTDRTRLTPELPKIKERAVTVKFLKTFGI